jgi:hypothetical protein
MCTAELIKKIKENSKNITPEERTARLIRASIIDEHGNYDSRYFTKKTVMASINRRSTIINITE